MTHRDRCTGGRMQIAALMATERDNVTRACARVSACVAVRYRPPSTSPCCYVLPLWHAQTKRAARRRIEGTRMVRSVRFEQPVSARYAFTRDVKPAPPIFFRPFRRQFSPASPFISLYARPCHPSRSSQRRLRCNIYIYISSGKYESLSMFDLAGVGLKKKGDRGIVSMRNRRILCFDKEGEGRRAKENR